MSKIVFWEPCAQKQKPKKQLGKTDSMRAKKTFFKRSENSIIGGTKHATPSLGNKKHEKDWTCF